MDGSGIIFLLGVFGSIILFFMFMYFVPVGLWITAVFAGVKVTIGELIGMRIRKVPPSIIVNSLITATKAGLQVTTGSGPDTISCQILIKQSKMEFQMSAPRTLLVEDTVLRNFILTWP